MAVNPGDYALVVGINDYPYFQPLRGAIEDAAEFDTWLRNTSVGGGVPDANCLFVKSSASPLRPIQDDIDDALQKIIDQATKAKDGRRLYVYFSGHGVGPKRTNTALCLARWGDRSPGFRNAALDANDYLELILGLGSALFSEVVFLMDCCRVRKVNAQGHHSNIGLARAAEDSGRNRLFLGFATEHWNPAYEAAMGDQAQASDVRGHFSRALIDALSGAAAVGGAGVPATRLKAYLERETPLIAQRAGHQQNPEVINGLPSSPEPIFGSAQPLAANVTIRFRPTTTGLVALQNGLFVDVHRDDAGTGPWRLSLPLGLYRLRAAATGRTEDWAVDTLLPVEKEF